MATKTTKTTPKISVKIWKPVLEKLDKKLDAACLRRDAYLGKLLESEIDYLDQEVSIPNSQASYDYVSGQLELLDRKLVSLALPPTLTARLNEICKRKLIVRDAFFNRLFLILAASPSAIDRLFFSGIGPEWRADVWREWKQDGSFFQNGFYPLEASVDPFWAIRAGIDIYADQSELVQHVDPTNGKVIRVKCEFEAVCPADSLYTTALPKKLLSQNLVGMSCFMPDWQIPGHDAQTQMQKTLDELLGEL